MLVLSSYLSFKDKYLRMDPDANKKINYSQKWGYALTLHNEFVAFISDDEVIQYCECKQI